jgi:heptosyltransferase II
MRILVIKLGYSETLDQEIGKVPSLGDVLRTTPILWAIKEKYPDSQVSWLVSEAAEPLLQGNPLIDRLLVWDGFVQFQLMREKYDVLINLEKIPGVCALADMIDAWAKYGFRFDSLTGQYLAYEKGLSFIDYLRHKETTKTSTDYWQKVLIEMLGVPWSQQECIIGYTPKTKVTCDFGLNFQVGSKWPSKAMPTEKWQEVGDQLNALGHTVSWQEGLGDLYAYMDWINSCEVLITQDSLGLHIALALGKKVVALFGPTGFSEVFLYYRCVVVEPPPQCTLRPCYASRCLTGMNCMEQIDSAAVSDISHKLLLEADNHYGLRNVV